jgi:hypothetical protein
VAILDKLRADVRRHPARRWLGNARGLFGSRATQDACRPRTCWEERLYKPLAKWLQQARRQRLLPRARSQLASFSVGRRDSRQLSLSRFPRVAQHTSTAWRSTAAAARNSIQQRRCRRIESVVIREVDVPRRWLRKAKGRLWYCPQDVPADRVRRVITFAEIAASPVPQSR